ncbi:hypothetical protein ZOSMA_236G00130 [Zostera marina]|uniref:Uncharacterized protein n=1 Tax=Zostera marina TaxID=29655 RepID=A0A0K9PHY1_ZOSMR|nr:hypothetical protein ZOSMA_236G00130 [Zostera marina]
MDPKLNTINSCGYLDVHIIHLSPPSPNSQKMGNKQGGSNHVFSLIVTYGFLLTSANTDSHNVVKFIGVSECSDCGNDDSFKGIQVAVVCKSEDKSTYDLVGVGESSKDGKFSVQLPASLLKKDGTQLTRQCFAQLHSKSKNAPCPIENHPDSLMLSLASTFKSEGEAALHVFATATGKLAFSRSVCAQKNWFECSNDIFPWFKFFKFCSHHKREKSPPPPKYYQPSPPPPEYYQPPPPTECKPPSPPPYESPKYEPSPPKPPPYHPPRYERPTYKRRPKYTTPSPPTEYKPPPYESPKYEPSPHKPPPYHPPRYERPTHKRRPKYTPPPTEYKSPPKHEPFPYHPPRYEPPTHKRRPKHKPYTPRTPTYHPPRYEPPTHKRRPKYAPKPNKPCPDPYQPPIHI